MPGEKKNLLGEALSAVRKAIRDKETGSVHLASPSLFRTRTANARTKKSRPRRNRAVNSSQCSQNFPLSVPDLFLEITSGVTPDSALSGHGPCFVRGTVALDDVSFTMKIAYIVRATLNSERHWISLNIGTGSIVWTPKHLRG